MAASKRLVALGLLGLLLAGCGSDVLFQSSFNADTPGAPPSLHQATGTVSVAGGPGSVVVVGPISNAGNDQWVRISRNDANNSPIASMQANLTQVRGDGTYSLLAVLDIPKGGQLATLEFEALNITPSPVSILHLDFANRCGSSAQNAVRINDHEGSCFGTFQNDQSFTVSVTLDINPTQPTAHVQLLGGGASGAADIPLATPLFEPATFAERFGAVTFFVGSPWTAPFNVTDILVTYHRPTTTIANAPP